MPQQPTAIDPDMFVPHTKEASGLYCFLNADRACGPECMAFATPPNHKDFVGQQWANCSLLVNMHRTGKHLTILAQTVDELRKKQEDAARIQPPPQVR